MVPILISMIGIIKIGIGDIVRYDDAIGVVIDITTDNPSPTPGCLIHWLYRGPDGSESGWVFIDKLDLIRDA